MEAIAANLILLIILLRDTVHICLRLHSHTESGIEGSAVRLTWHFCLTCLDTDDICRVVKRCKVSTSYKSILYLLGDKD